MYFSHEICRSLQTPVEVRFYSGVVCPMECTSYEIAAISL